MFEPSLALGSSSGLEFKTFPGALGGASGLVLNLPRRLCLNFKPSLALKVVHHVSFKPPLALMF